MANRVHIDAPAGVIEIEGEREFVEGALAKFLPLVEQAGFGSRPRSQAASQEADDELPADGDTGPADDAGKPKIKRKRGSPPPKGQSCGDRIRTLKADGFFKEHHGLQEIIAGLKAKGWTHNTNQVSAAADRLFKRNLIQRAKEGNGPWTFYWDRD
ncbi:hypothetical protein [Mesorhizobium sp.]|uniref:hypothetical protein n=1 Tax=Mesorhizobium sp. TaxID=1871066 RepID=UPI0012114A9C|nr:hypothetical protein [Mesorhizobium sp.]TIT01463.1 MAG: hypothetical protein E5W87_14710 [Mesorhizobium sp.]